MSDPEEQSGDEDGFLLAEFESDDASAEDPDAGLEMGEAQAAELRQIFLTTLPQYLEPLEELLEQVLGSDEVGDDAVGTLATTIDSILEAAQRIGVEDIAVLLIEMQGATRELAFSEPGELADELRGALAKIKERAGASPTSSGPTLVAALSGLEGFEPAVLKKLTAAGLVTVSQLEMARKDEIVAVSGLSEGTVDQLLAALGIGGARPHRHIRARVEAEEAVSEARWRLQRAHGHIATLRRELEVARVAAKRVRLESIEARRRIEGLRVRRARARDELEAARRRRMLLEEQTRSAEARMAELADAMRDARSVDAELLDQLTDLGDRMRLLLDRVGHSEP